MIRHLKIVGLGPHEEFEADFEADGVTTVMGPSEVGKSTIMEAVLFALWGRNSDGGRFAPEYIRDGTDRAVVELTLDTGKIIRRSITRTRSQTRGIRLGSRTQSFGSDAKFLAALGELGEEEEVNRLVVSPFGWIPLVSGNARKFRDILSTILPGGDIAAEVQRLLAARGFTVSREEAGQSEKEVAKARTASRKTRDQATGRVEATEEQIEGLRARLAEARAVAPASDLDIEDILRRADLWESWEQENGRDATFTLRQEQQQAWDRRRAALGEAPAGGRSFEEVRADEKKARAALKEAMGAFTAVDQRATVEQQKLTALEAHEGGCPTCQRDGWSGWAEALEQQRSQTEAVQQERATALAGGKAARAAHNQAKEALEQARAMRTEQARWEAAIRALGERPEVPEPAGDGGPAPTVERPGRDEIEEAREARSAAAAREAGIQQRERDLAEAEERLKREQAAAVAARAEADRYDVLIDAVRSAPTMVVERQAREALGDMGPVSLEFGDKTAVSVLIDGRPWWLASRGRRVVADTCLRHALRRALEREWLPIIIDNVQDVGGQPLPDVPGPLIILQTTNGRGLSIKRSAPSGLW